MPFGLVDDQLHSHVKWRRATKGARSLWTTALSWCSGFASDGFIPDDMLRVLDGTKKEAECLISVGLWVREDGGFRFHEWDQRNPDAASFEARRLAKSTGGKLGNHRRWHTKGAKVAGCEWCEESDSDRSTDQGSDNGPNRTGPGPGPSPISTYVSSPATSKSRASDAADPHPQSEFQNAPAVLASHGMTRDEIGAFIGHLKGTGVRSPGALISKAHRDGTLDDRIDEWRIVRDARAPAPTDRQAQILRAEMDRARAADAATNVVHLPQIGAGS